MAEKLEIADEMIAGRRGDPRRKMPADMPRWMAKIIIGIDTFSHWTGNLLAWLTLPLLFSMVYEVFMRYTFTAPTIWAYDMSRMLYGGMFMLGAAYALAKGVHIRSDFLYRKWSVKNQARTDLAFYLVCFFPAMVICVWVSGEWAWTAVSRGERGMDTAWMPLLGPIKSAVPIGIAFLVIQGISEALQCVYALQKGRWPE